MWVHWFYFAKPKSELKLRASWSNFSFQSGASKSDDLIIWEWVFLVVLVSRGCSCQFQVSLIWVVKFYGNWKTGGVSFLVVQWLGLHAFTARTQVQSLIGELRSCKLWGAAGKKKKGLCHVSLGTVTMSVMRSSLAGVRSIGGCSPWLSVDARTQSCQHAGVCRESLKRNPRCLYHDRQPVFLCFFFLLLLLLFKLWRRNGLSVSEFGAICAPGESECPEDGSRSLCRLWWAL